MLGETPESMAERAQRVDDRSRADDQIPEIKVGPLRIENLRGPTDLVIDHLEVHPGAIVGVAGRFQDTLGQSAGGFDVSRIVERGQCVQRRVRANHLDRAGLPGRRIEE